MYKRANPDNLMVVIADLKGVLICFNSLKDLSAEQLVTGSGHRSFKRVFMLGNIELV
jgi:hypothetical protein